MVFLLIDNSNTRTKIRLSTADTLGGFSVKLLTSEIDAESLGSHLDLLNWDLAVIASVVPEKLAILRNYLSAKGPTHIVTKDSPLGYDFSIESSESTGADRLANLAALAALYQGPAIAIDCGTAVTFSILSKENKFIGGAIAPGIDLATRSLSNFTAQLPLIEPSLGPPTIGKTTSEALNIGIVRGHIGMVREILLSILATLPAGPTVIATGGGTKWIEGKISQITEIHPDLTLEGLRIIGKNLALSGHSHYPVPTNE